MQTLLRLSFDNNDDQRHAEAVAYRHGAIYTKPKIVEMILDLAGYTVDKPLAGKRILEPGCGECGFLEAIVPRLLLSYFSQGGSPDRATFDLRNCIRAIDIDSEAVRTSRRLVSELLESSGIPAADSLELVDSWLLCDDFLLYHWKQEFDYVVGNPPYIRIEDLPKEKLQQYRNQFVTIGNRADLYVPFFELGLRLLSNTGCLAFICTNRFVKNRYGKDLRRFIADSYRVRFYIDLEHTQPFLTEVSAYPAIFVLDREIGNAVRTAALQSIDDEFLEEICNAALAPKLEPGGPMSEFRSWYENDAPWISSCPSKTELLNRLRVFPFLEETGAETRAGIGVATGADRVFIIRSDAPVERVVLLPLALAKDISNKIIRWSHHYVINPFKEDGSLVSLEHLPMLKRYFELHQEVLKKRHTAKDAGDRWYKTIDRIWLDLAYREKLLIPDIQTSVTIGHDNGTLYPHHNLYYVVSRGWNLRVLKALMRSAFVLFQMEAHSVQMRGGAIRFQTQSLRKLRLPRPDTMSAELVKRLVALSDSDDVESIDSVACEAYQCEAPELRRFRSHLGLKRSGG